MTPRPPESSTVAWIIILSAAGGSRPEGSPSVMLASPSSPSVSGSISTVSPAKVRSGSPNTNPSKPFGWNGMATGLTVTFTARPPAAWPNISSARTRSARASVVERRSSGASAFTWMRFGMNSSTKNSAVPMASRDAGWSSCAWQGMAAERARAARIARGRCMGGRLRRMGLLLREIEHALSPTAKEM